MIDPVASSFEPLSARRRPESAGAFSYADAAAALEKNAGRSLKAHGARPQGGDVAKAPTTTRPRDAGEAARTSADEGPIAVNAERETPQPSPSTVAPVDESSRAATAAPAVQSQSTGGASSPSLVATAQEPAAVAQATKPAAPTTAATSEPTRAQSVAKPASPTAPSPVRSPEEFAELIARRLDEGATEFDLRLDPPELGRIEARLTVGDDGAAELRIRFDNQTAYDLFARDEAALRLAFADAGYSFGDGAFAFVFDERAGVERKPSASSESVRPYAAPVAARALDIRV